MEKSIYILIFLIPFIGLSQYWNAQIFYKNIKLDFRYGSEDIIQWTNKFEGTNAITNF